MITQEQIDNWFQYHPPADDKTRRAYEELRESAKRFAADIIRLSPASADQTAAVRKVREAVMTANAAIACEGR